jgi:hypothetical protein
LTLDADEADRRQSGSAGPADEEPAAAGWQTKPQNATDQDGAFKTNNLAAAIGARHKFTMSLSRQGVANAKICP